MAATKRRAPEKDIETSKEPRKSRRVASQAATSSADSKHSKSTSANVRIPRSSKKSDGADVSKGGPRRGKSPESKEAPVSEEMNKSNIPSTKLHVGSNGDRQYWLMKAEPESRIEKGVDVKFTIDDLRLRTEPEAWDGVRNYIARNNMRAMRKGDLAFFYYSNCKSPGIIGVMEIVREASTDESAFDEKNPYYDPKDSPEKAKWSVVHVEFRRKFGRLVGLQELKSFAQDGGALSELATLKQSRLSVSKITNKQWDFIISLAEKTVDES